MDSCKCYKDGCDRRADWCGWVMFWPEVPWKAYGQKRAYAHACEEHRDTATLADVLTDDLWASFDALRHFGVEVPERTSFDFEFRPALLGVRRAACHPRAQRTATGAPVLSLTTKGKHTEVRVTLHREPIGNVTPRLLNIKDAARYISRTPKALRHMIERRKLPVVRCGRRVQIERDALDKWIRECSFAVYIAIVLAGGQQ